MKNHRRCDFKSEKSQCWCTTWRLWEHSLLDQSDSWTSCIMYDFSSLTSENTIYCSYKVFFHFIIIIQAFLMTFLSKKTLSIHLGELNKWDESVLEKAHFKRIWQTNRNCYYRLPWFAIFPNFLKENKHTEPMDSVCCSGTLGMCLISSLSSTNSRPSAPVEYQHPPHRRVWTRWVIESMYLYSNRPESRVVLAFNPHYQKKETQVGN